MSHRVCHSHRACHPDRARHSDRACHPEFISGSKMMPSRRSRNEFGMTRGIVRDDKGDGSG